MSMIRLPPMFFMALQAILTNYVTQLGNDRPLQRPLRPSYDYIIVGGGTSGAVLASRLSEGPDSVLLVEAGRCDLENENVLVPAYAANIQLTQDDWNYFSVSHERTGLAMNNRREYWPRGKILGGCSSTGYSTHHRGSVIDYNEWAAEGATGWSYRDVLSYFLKSEDMQIPALAQSPYHSTGGPLTITTGASTPVHNFFQAASSELAFQTIDCNGPDSIGMRNGQDLIGMYNGRNQT